MRPVNVGWRSPQRLFVGLVALSTLLAGTAIAEKKPTAAELQAAAEEFDAGLKAIKRQDYDAAAARFEGADREVPSPGAIQASIRARRDAKQMDRAATLAEQALLRYPENAPLVAFAKGVVEAAAKDLQRVEVSCAPACVLAVDAKLLHGEPATTVVLYTSPGKHTVSASWKKKSLSEDVDAKAGGTKAVKLAEPADPTPAPTVAPVPSGALSGAPATSAAPTDSASPPPPPPSSGLPKPVFFAGAGVTAILAGVTIWSGVDTQSNPGVEKVKRVCAGRGENCKVYQQGLEKQRRTNALLAGTLSAAAVTGVIAIFTNWKSAPAPTTAGKIVPNAAIGPSGGWVEATVAF